MMDQPSMLELVDAVRAFLEKRAMPELTGHTAFHARVAANALGIVSRELKLGPQLSAEEKERLVALLGMDAPLDSLNRELCRRIREGSVDLDTPGLKEHLIAATRGKVTIDQPNYSGLKQMPGSGRA
jgi:hypothetical protein